MIGQKCLKSNRKLLQLWNHQKCEKIICNSARSLVRSRIRLPLFLSSCLLRNAYLYSHNESRVTNAFIFKSVIKRRKEKYFKSIIWSDRVRISDRLLTVLVGKHRNEWRNLISKHLNFIGALKIELIIHNKLKFRQIVSLHIIWSHYNFDGSTWRCLSQLFLHK